MLISQKPRVLILQAKGKPRGCQLWWFPWVTAIWSRGAQSMSDPHQPGGWLVVNHNHLRGWLEKQCVYICLWMFILKPFMVILGSMDGLFLGLLYYHITPVNTNKRTANTVISVPVFVIVQLGLMGIGMGRFLSFLWSHQVFPWTKFGYQALDFQMVQSATSKRIYDGLRSSTMFPP